MTHFGELKSQEEIDREAGYDWFKWYMIISGGLSAIFYLVVIAALLTYIWQSWL